MKRPRMLFPLQNKHIAHIKQLLGPRLGLRMGPQWVSSWALGALAVALMGSVSPRAVFASDFFEMGMKQFQAENFELAIYYFRKAVHENVHNPNVHYYLADSLVKTNRFSEAQAEYQRILAMAPQSTAAKMARVNLIHLRSYGDPFLASRFKTQGTSLSSETLDELALPKLSRRENYLDVCTLNGQTIRWSVFSFPLKVFVDRNGAGVRNFQPAFLATVPHALEVWSKALGNKLRFMMVSDPQEADIRVQWVNSIDTVGMSTDRGTAFTAGITAPVVTNNQLQSMEMKVATFDIKGNALNADRIQLVVIHEMGHALGLLGHSNNLDDMMSYDGGHSEELTTRDVNTIRLLYSNPANITSRPQDPSRMNDSGYQREMAGKFDQSILQQEKEVQERPTNLGYLNLGSSYFQKGKQLDNAVKELLESKGSEQDAKVLHEEAIGWYRRALAATHKSLELEPNNAHALYNRCLIQQALGNYRSALVDIDAAIKFDSKNFRYLLDKAFVQAKLDRKPDARATLKMYLIRSPESANTPEVKQIERMIEG